MLNDAVNKTDVLGLSIINWIQSLFHSCGPDSERRAVGDATAVYKGKAKVAINVTLSGGALPLPVPPFQFPLPDLSSVQWFTLGEGWDYNVGLYSLCRRKFRCHQNWRFRVCEGIFH